MDQPGAYDPRPTLEHFAANSETVLAIDLAPPTGRDHPLLQLLVFPLSDSFSALWPALAEQCGLSCTVTFTDTCASGAGSADIGIVDGGGAEDALEEAVRQLARGDRRVRDIVAVGARADLRLTAALMRAGAAQYFALPGDLGALRAWLRGRADAARAELRPAAPVYAAPGGALEAAGAGDIPFPATLSEITRAAVCAMLRCCGGNKSEAARRLGISRPRLQRILGRRTGADFSTT